MAWLVGGVVLALVAGNALFSAWAEITVKSAWYRSLGIEAAYDTRWQLSLVLSAIGVVSTYERPRITPGTS